MRPLIIFISCTAVLCLISCNKDDIGPNAVKDIDGNIYKTVEIGQQVWMAENLKTRHYTNGYPILTGLDTETWDTTTQGAWCIYPHSRIETLYSEESVVAAYGLLYNWHATVDSRGLCPRGWRVPSQSDIAELVEHLKTIRADRLGELLKSCRRIESPLGGDCATYVHPRWNSHQSLPEIVGTDDVGFAGTPGGNRTFEDTYIFSVGLYGNWWTTQSYIFDFDGREQRMAYSLGLASFDSDLRDGLMQQNFGSSVRCIKD